MKKAFKAANEMVVIKMFIGDNDPFPAGWYATPREALDSQATPAVELPQSGTAATDAAPKRGRPRKAA